MYFNRSTGKGMRAPDRWWGRLSGDTNCGLRRGAWYRVVALLGANAVVSVGSRKPLTVPRGFLELTHDPPIRWTHVANPPASPHVPVNLRGGYLVCPHCRHRAQFPGGKPAKLRCPWCNELSEIAWESR